MISFIWHSIEQKLPSARILLTRSLSFHFQQSTAIIEANERVSNFHSILFLIVFKLTTQNEDDSSSTRNLRDAVIAFFSQPLSPLSLFRSCFPFSFHSVSIFSSLSSDNLISIGSLYYLNHSIFALDALMGIETST